MTAATAKPTHEPATDLAEFSTHQERARDYPILVQWSPEDRRYVAEVVDLPEVVGYGHTSDEATADAVTALAIALQTYVERGWTPPAPQTRQSTSPRASGQFRLRLPRDLHARLVARAARESVSLNALVGSLIAEALGRLDEHDRIATPLVQVSRDTLSQTVAACLREVVATVIRAETAALARRRGTQLSTLQQTLAEALSGVSSSLVSHLSGALARTYAEGSAGMEPGATPETGRAATPAATKDLFVSASRYEPLARAGRAGQSGSLGVWFGGHSRGLRHVPALGARGDAMGSHVAGESSKAI